MAEASASDPLLPVESTAQETSGQNAVSQSQQDLRGGKRFRWLSLGIVSISGLLGPLLVLILGARLGLTNRSCKGCPQNEAMIPSLLTGSINPTSGSQFNASASELVALSQGLGADLPWLHKQADKLTRAWGLGSRLQFTQIADEEDSIESVLSGPAAYSGAVIVAFVSGPPPIRCSQEQPYMSTADGSGQVADLFPFSSLNAAAALLEGRLGRRLFPMTLETATINKSSPAEPPFALFDVSSGRIVLDHAVVENIHSIFGNGLSDSLATFADSLFSQISRISQIEEYMGLASIAKVVTRAAVAAIGIAIAYQVPLWFCVACPAVLGLLTPIVINSGLGALAQFACEKWSLPPAECADLWYGAFAAGMVLSLASAVPIVFVCKLPQCAHRQ